MARSRPSIVRNLRRGVHLSYHQNKRRKHNPPSWRFDAAIVVVAVLMAVSYFLI